MDEEEQEAKASSSIFGRFRSPSFKKQEVNILLQLIEKHKNVLLNKSNNASANYAKDKAWGIITKEINKLSIGPERSPEVLKTKWENLKRSARKLSKDVLDEDCDFNNDEISQTIRLISNESKSNEHDQNISLKSLIGCEDEGADYKLWASDVDHDSSAFAVDNDLNAEIQEKYNKYESSPRFSPQECSILLQCVRQEKNVLFSKTSLFKKHQAWKRIAQSYNNQSPRKRTSKELSSKFNTLKSMAKRVNVKGFFNDKKRKAYELLTEDVKPNVKKIKSEPVMDCIADFEFEDSDDDIVLNRLVDRTSTERLDISSSRLERTSAKRLTERASADRLVENRLVDRNSVERLFAQDPLNARSSNSDSGLGSCPETKDATRLKIDLLNYKMETARLERKRVEEAIKADQKEREMRALEQSLRLRTARLQLAAAEGSLPPAHPARRHAGDEELLY